MTENLIINADEKFKINESGVDSIVTELMNDMDFTIDEVQINFLDENQILELNKEYLQHDYNTDIITFNYSGDNHILEGEIFISVDDAAYNAGLYEVSRNSEILRLIIHGFLHLLGYDDITPEEKKIQKEHEDRLVDKLSYLATNLCE